MSSPLPILKLPLPKAIKLLNERIEKGEVLWHRIPNNESDLEKVKAHYYSWDEYNADLLRKLVGGHKLSDQYEGQDSIVWGVGTLQDDIEELKRDIESHIRLLESIRDRLHLFELESPKPLLAIKDKELYDRTSDLLNAPGSYDRVIREATTILEDRIRKKMPFNDLAQIIPKAFDQSGDNLTNKLLSPSSPILDFGDKSRQTRVFRMMGGVMAYLRNPSHHRIDATIEWSWAWSVVGLVDQLLADLDTATYKRPIELK